MELVLFLDLNLFFKFKMAFTFPSAKLTLFEKSYDLLVA